MFCIHIMHHITFFLGETIPTCYSFFKYFFNECDEIKVSILFSDNSSLRKRNTNSKQEIKNSRVESDLS